MRPHTALAEDRAIFEVMSRPASPVSAAGLPACDGLAEDVRDYPEAISQALNQLRLESVDGPYSLALSADLSRRSPRPQTTVT